MNKHKQVSWPRIIWLIVLAFMLMKGGRLCIDWLVGVFPEHASLIDQAGRFISVVLLLIFAVLPMLVEFTVDPTLKERDKNDRR